MNKEVKIRITTDGKVEVDSSIFENCRDVANHLSKILGKTESFHEKDEAATEETIKIKGE